MKIMNNSGSIENNSNYQDWIELVKENTYDRGNKTGYWICYYNEKNELIYEYIYT